MKDINGVFYVVLLLTSLAYNNCYSNVTSEIVLISFSCQIYYSSVFYLYSFMANRLYLTQNCYLLYSIILVCYTVYFNNQCNLRSMEQDVIFVFYIHR